MIMTVSSWFQDHVIHHDSPNNGNDPSIRWPWTSLMKDTFESETNTVAGSSSIISEYDTSSSESSSSLVSDENISSEHFIYGIIKNMSEPEAVISPYNNNNNINSGNFSLNETSYWAVRDPLYIVIPITVIYILILITGLLGNIVTCVVIIRSRYLHTATNYYLFSLAISDLLLLLSGLPLEVHNIWRRYPDVFGEVFCVVRGLASETSANATVLTITAFTVERYLAICRPFLIQKWQNKLSRVVRQILFIWVIAILLAIPQALQMGIVPFLVANGERTLICSVKKVIIPKSFEISTFVFFVGPMILITALYCLIALTLRNSSHVQESKLRLRKSLSGHKTEVGQQRVLKMLVAVVVAFFVCWAPFHAQRLIAIWGYTWLESSEAIKTTYHILTYVSGVLYYLSTCINPILYHIMSLKFRHAFQEMVNGCYGDEAKRRGRYGCGSGDAFDRHSLSARSLRSNGVILTEITTVTAATNNNYPKTLNHLPPKSNRAVAAAVL